VTNPAANDRSEQIHRRYRRSIEAELETVEGTSLGRTMQLILHVAMGLTVVLAPVALFLGLRSGWRRGRARPIADRLHRTEEFARRTKPVRACPLMVNPTLRRTSEQPSTALVIISFDPAVSHETMIELAAKISDPDAPGWNAAQRGFAQALMDDEQFHAFRRRTIPRDMTGGVEVFACDLAVHPILLAGGHLSHVAPFIQCVAEPGERGAILQIPWWIADDAPPPGPNERQAAQVMLFMFTDLEKMAAAH
jgi:hypothetical protein